MDNFFGIGTCSSAYDMRRHVNLFFVLFIESRRIANGDSFMNQVINILRSPSSEAVKAAQMKNILSDLELNFLNHMAYRYGLSDSDLTTILSGRTFFDKSTNSPAGYNGVENWTMLTQLVYAAYLTPSYCHSHIAEIYFGPIKAWVSNVRGITYQSKTIGTVAEGMNECFDKGWRQFTDLPKIEKHVVEKARRTFGSF